MLVASCFKFYSSFKLKSFLLCENKLLDVLKKIHVIGRSCAILNAGKLLASRYDSGRWALLRQKLSLHKWRKCEEKVALCPVAADGSKTHFPC